MTMKKSVLITAIAISCSSCLYDNGETIVLPVDDINPEQDPPKWATLYSAAPSPWTRALRSPSTRAITTSRAL